MTWFEDGSDCTYFGNCYGLLKAVGWLEGDELYTAGELSVEEKEAIDRLASTDSFRIDELTTFGEYVCSFCNKHSDSANFFVPDIEQGFVWAAPSMIIHYVNEHEYVHPAEFLHAVAKCPDIPSIDFLKQLVEKKKLDGIART